MLRHRNYYAMTSVVDSMEDHYRADDVMLLYLPLAHNFGRLMLLTGAYVGFPIAFLPDPLRVAEAMLAGAADRAAERAARVREGVRRGAVALRRGDRSQAAAHRLGAPDRARGQPPAGGREPDSARPGDAPSSRRPARLQQGQGASRRAAADPDLRRSPAREGDRRVLRRGRHPHPRGLRADGVHDRGQHEPARPLPLRHRRPRASGLRGRPSRTTASSSSARETVFQGYFKDPEATAAVLSPDGWLRTGDVGDIDADGFISITDRKKDILVTAGGKNVAPQNIENDLKTSKYVSQALVVGDRRPVRRGADHPGRGGDPPLGVRARSRRRPCLALPRRARSRGRSGGRRRRQPRALALRAGQALRAPPPRLHDGGGRGHADAQAPAPRGQRALLGRDRELYARSRSERPLRAIRTRPRECGSSYDRPSTGVRVGPPWRASLSELAATGCGARRPSSSSRPGSRS